MLERINEIPGVVLSADEYLDDFWPNFRKIDDVFWKLERIQSFRQAGEPSWVAMMEGDWDRSLKLIGDRRDAGRADGSGSESLRGGGSSRSGRRSGIGDGSESVGGGGSGSGGESAGGGGERVDEGLSGGRGDGGGRGESTGGGERGRSGKKWVCKRIRVVEQPVTPYVQWEMHVLALKVAEVERVRVLDVGEVAEVEVGRRLPELVVLGTSVMYEVTYDGAGTHSGARRIDDREVIAACRGELDKLFAKSEEFQAYYEREIVPLSAPRETS